MTTKMMTIVTIIYTGIVIRSGASKGTPGDAKCVTEILGGDKNKEVRGDKIYLSVLREN